MGQQQKLKNYSAIALISLLGIVATGCSKASNNTTPKTSQIRLWRLDQDVEPFRNLGKEFIKTNEKTYPGLSINYQQKRLEGYEFNALKSLAGRLGPDIWSIPNDWIGDYQDQITPLPDTYYKGTNDKTVPIAAETVSKLYPKGIAEQLISTDGKKVYGLPTNADSLQLYINRALFDDAYSEFKKSLGQNPRDEVLQPVRQLLNRPPATWSDVVEQIKYITKRDGTTITRSGIALGTADNIPASQDVLQLLMFQNGAKIVSDDHKSVLFQVPNGTPSGGQVRPGEKALEFFNSFSDPTKQTYSWNPSMPQALDAFAQGKVAMVVAYSDFGKKLAIKRPGFSAEVQPAPQITTSQVAVNYIKFSVETVTRTADNQNAAFNFMKQYTNSGMAKSLASLKKVRTPYLEALKQSDDLQSAQVLTGRTTYKANHTEFDAVFRQMIVDTSQNRIAVPDAIKAGADKIDQLLNPTLAATKP